LNNTPPLFAIGLTVRTPALFGPVVAAALREFRAAGHNHLDQQAILIDSLRAKLLEQAEAVYRKEPVPYISCRKLRAIAAQLDQEQEQS
jgi:hypothetical protein